MRSAPHYLRCALLVSTGVAAFSFGARLATGAVVCKSSEAVMGHPSCFGCANSDCPFCTLVEPGGGRGGVPSCSPTTKRFCEGWYAWRTVGCGGCETAVQDVPCYYTYSCNPPPTCAGNPCFAGPPVQSQSTFQDERCVGGNCDPCP
jgi:hypothetical protein